MSDKKKTQTDQPVEAPMLVPEELRRQAEDSRTWALACKQFRDQMEYDTSKLEPAHPAELGISPDQWHQDADVPLEAPQDAWTFWAAGNNVVDVIQGGRQDAGTGPGSDDRTQGAVMCPLCGSFSLTEHYKGCGE